jgi:creatinine amidohydrolase
MDASNTVLLASHAVTEFDFSALAYPDVERLLRDGPTPVLLLPLGAVEAHGPHAAVATDLIISLGVCGRAATRLQADPEVRALVLPPLPYGVTRYAAAFAGTISIREETLRALVLEIAASLAAHGFDRLVLVNNHFEPEHVRVLRRTGLPLLDLTRRANAERLTEEFRSGSCHAGRYETSLVLADDPKAVDRERMAALPTKMVDMPAAMAAGRNEFLAMGMDEAYCGSPAEASAEEGEATFATLTDLLVELIREVARA